MRPAEDLLTRIDLKQPATAQPKSGGATSNAAPSCGSKLSGAGPHHTPEAASEEPDAPESVQVGNFAGRDRSPAGSSVTAGSRAVGCPSAPRGRLGGRPPEVHRS